MRTVAVALQLQIGQYVSRAAEASRTTRNLAGELNAAAKNGRLDAVANSATRMGIAMGGAFALAVGAAAKFDKQMSEVSAVSNATGDDLEKLRQAALAAGKDTQFSATEAAKAEAELAKAGLNTSDILGGALRGSLDLAAAGSLDLAEAADISAKAMNMFGLKGSDVSHIADVLSASANKSATDVHEIGAALNMSGLAANAAGLSLEETVGTLSAFADRALNGSDAGTSFKQMLLMIQAPSQKAADLMKDLGINAYDTSGKFVGAARLAGILQEKLGGLTQEQRNAALATIFGADAMRAANILYTVGEQGIRDYTAAVDDTGAAAETARKKTDNLAGDVERLTGSLETLAIESGSGANSGLRTLVQLAGSLVDQFGQLPPAIGSTVTVIAGVSAAALLLGSGWVKARKATADFLTELSAVGPTGERTARGLQSATRWAGRAAAAFAVWQTAMALVSSTQKDLNPQVDALGQSLAKWATDGQIAGEAARVLGGDMDEFNRGFKYLADTSNGRRQTLALIQGGFEKMIPGMAGVNGSLAKTKERVDAMDQAMADMVRSGSADTAAGIFDKLAKDNAAAGISMSEMQKMFPQYAASLQVAGDAASTTAGKTKDLGAATAEAAASTKKLQEAFDELFDVQMSADEALLDYQKGVRDLNQELRSGSRTLNGNTEEGYKNAEAVLTQINRIQDLREARLGQGEAMDTVNGKYTADIRGLQRSMLAAGFTKKEIDALTGAYLRIPDQVRTPVSAPGATTATTQANNMNFAVRRIPDEHGTMITVSAGNAIGTLQSVKSWLDAIPRSKQSTVYINRMDRGMTPNRWGGIYTHAAEGALREAGVFSPIGPARYAYAEPETGGEGFVPRFGNYARSTAIIDREARWYGGRFVPGGAVAGGTTIINKHYHSYTLPNHGVIGSRMELENWFVGVLDSVQRKGRT